MKKWPVYVLAGLTRLVSDLPLLWMFYFLYFEKEGPGAFRDALVNAALFVSFGILHSFLARNVAKKYLARWLGERLVRIVYVWIAGITLSLVLYLWRPLPGTLWRTQGGLSWFLSLLYLASVIGIVWTASLIDYADFIGIRVLLRTIKNQPSAPAVFSVRGPYAHCRHPMYLLLLIALWIGPKLTYTMLEFAILASAYLLAGVHLEERNLRKELGEIYDLYRDNVPMWVPRLSPWKLE